LKTAWERDFWETRHVAPYPKRSYRLLTDWDQLKRSLPLPGIGVYIKQKDRNFLNENFSYIRITGMEYDENTEQPIFHFEFVAKSKTESIELLNKGGFRKKELFFSIDGNSIIKILKDLGEDPPREWLELLETGVRVYGWRDWIGSYFLELESEYLSNDEFEDRVARLLGAIGFEVVQRGHTVEGDYPDGIAKYGNYVIVYDCKNTRNYFPNEADLRAIKKYQEDEMKRLGEDKKYFAMLIAKSAKPTVYKDVFTVPVGSLLFLLYKKLVGGIRFMLDPIKRILEDKIWLTEDNLEKEYIVI